MADHRVESYKRSVEKVMDHWSKEIKKDMERLKAVNQALEEAEAKKKKKGKDKEKDKGPLKPVKSPEDLKKERTKLQKSIDAKKKNLEVNLKLIPPPPEDVPEKETSKLPKLIQGIIAKKGVPLSDVFVLKPDVEFDFKKGQIKKLQIDLVWQF